MINHLPKEGYNFFLTPQCGIDRSLEIFLAFCLLAIVLSMFAARWRRIRPRCLQWMDRFPKRSLLVIYFTTWLAFSFGYHALFQYDPFKFKVNAPLIDKNMFEALEEHKTAEDNIDAAREIIGFTVGALRTERGRNLLALLCRNMDGEVKSVYSKSLSVALVGPPRFLSPNEVEFMALANRSEEAAAILASQHGVLQLDPRADIPVLSDVAAFSTDKLHTMKDLLAEYLHPVISKPINLSDTLGSEDDDRLKALITQELGIIVDSRTSVDLREANTILESALLHLDTAIALGAQTMERLLDFGYFSLITITTVGYGDILPNSTGARAAVMLEIVLGMIIFASFANELVRPSRIAH
jgi:hypothetical protein